MMAPLDLSSIGDPAVREAIRGLLQLVEVQAQEIGVLRNQVETLTAENRSLRAANQQLRDEVQRLKGEQGRPPLPPSRLPPAAGGQHSSEAERRRPQGWSKGSKRDSLPIDREQTLTVDPRLLPPDAERKGHEPVLVQDLALHTDNVLFHKEKWYSASAGRIFLAPLPPGYQGGFGPGLRALSLALASVARMSEAKILELLRSAGVQISAGELSNLLVQGQEVFHAEAAAVTQAGLGSSPWQHLDDTETRVNGQVQHCFILCNPLYTAAVTLPGKDRLTVVRLLAGWSELRFRLTPAAHAYLAEVGAAQRVQAAVAALPQEQEFAAAAFGALLDERLPGLGPQQRRWVEEAAAIGAYRAQTAVPVIHTLVCDDAGQWRGVTAATALCWVHEGRHYKKLVPYFDEHRQQVERFLGRFWAYYDDLLVYQQAPSPARAAVLRDRFRSLFSTVTGYELLDERIAKTLHKQERLLQVLDHPELPLHNNPAELGARQRVRRRDVSFGPRTELGRRAWDTFLTLGETAAKLGVNFYHYLRDTLTGERRLPRLADLITAEAATLSLGASWAAS